jgi:site-specific DNA-methyltransferase (adenine-specific)
MPEKLNQAPVPAAEPLAKEKALRNRTISLSDSERKILKASLLKVSDIDPLRSPPVGTVNADFADVAARLPRSCVDLLLLDPPYNLGKDFHGARFSKRDTDEYSKWLDSVIGQLLPLLKETATIYICGDWLTSVSIFSVASSYFKVRNRITWEREKGRGARANWKNSAEDIWYCTMSDRYTFNVDAVKLRRRVIAPYRREDGSPKDWLDSAEGKFRDTHPSNIWTDITIPFWSMPENTCHPTQKSEKLIAKLLLASSAPTDYVLDPFLGSGTTSVVARKLGRQYLGVDINEEYCLLAEKRLQMADRSRGIQGFSDQVFWERNTLSLQSAGRRVEE